MPTPFFANSISDERDAQVAVSNALADLERSLGNRSPDIVMAFATNHFGAALEDLGPRIARATGAREVIGCSAESVIGGTRELERRAGLALWAACLPGNDVRFFEITARRESSGAIAFSGMPPVGDPAASSVLLVADPHSFPATNFLRDLNARHPGVPAMGGLASGSTGPGQSLLFTRDGRRTEGAIGVVLEGDIELRPVVSQGCRPVGRSWVVTGCEGNLIRKLGGKPAIEVLMQTWQELPPADQKLLQAAPFLGLAIDPLREDFQRGDFLVRPILGLHQADRSIAVGENVRRGQTVRLLVRDSASASEELRSLMRSEAGGPPPGEAENSVGALIFSCNGRGSHMFEEPDHDVRGVLDGLGAEIPVAGFFCAGEIGPIGGSNFVHGFTASVAVFRERAPDA